MRKLLLSFACILGMSAFAEDVTTTLTMSDANANWGEQSFTWKQSGFSLAAAKNNGLTNPTFNGSYNDARFYAKNSLTISADATIKSISFEISSQGLKRFAEITPSAGKIVEQGANPLLWNGSEKSVTFTVGDKSTYGTDGASKAGQFDFLSITIVTDGSVGGSTTPDPDPNPEPEDVVYKGLVDNADDWDFDYYWPEDGSLDVVAWDSKYGLKFTGFINKVAEETEVMAYTVVDLRGYKDCTLSFDHALNYLDVETYDPSWYVEADCIVIPEDVDDDAEIYWETLDIPNYPSGKDWNYVNSGSISLADYEGNICGFGLYYYSGPYIDDEDGPNIACTWEVKNFVITGKDASGVEQIIFDSNAPVEYYNLQGLRVDNPTNGIYIRRQGRQATKVLVK